MNIADTLLSEGVGSSTAILFKDEAMTYDELRVKVKRLASGLLKLGHEKGARIGILSENSAFFVVCYLAIIRAGFVAVPLQPELSFQDLEKIIFTARISNIFVSTRHARRFGSLAEKSGVTLLPESETGSLSADEFGDMPQVDPAHKLAALMFTSGSTGEPKGVMVTHRNIECNTRDIVSYMGLTRDDRVMVVLPFHYCFGISLLHTHLMAGGSLVLNNDFRLYPETVLQELLRKDCTGLAGVPSTYQLLLRKSRFRQMSFPKLRWLQQAGGKLPNPCIEEVRGSFPQMRFFTMYGQTEATARLSFLAPERLADKLGSVGRGLPSTRLEVVDSLGRSVKPGSDETGEIVARGDNVCPGYWDDPLETAKYFRDGKLYTGDLARVDPDGFIFIVEREREMIKSGGNRVSAKEIEDVIAELPEVIEVAVVGAPHEILGESIKAFVVATNQGSPESVSMHCRKRLPSFKVPEEVIFLQALPHNSSGKVVKPKLKALLSVGTVPPEQVLES